MEETSHPAASSGQALVDSMRAVVEVIAVALAGPYLVGIGFHLLRIDGARILGDTRLTFLFLAIEATLSLLLVAFLLRARRQSFRQLGWIWTRTYGEALIGLYCVPLLFATNFLVSGFFQSFLPGWVSRGNPLLDSIGNTMELALLLVSSILVGGIKEEIQRAFVLNRFEFDLGRLPGRLFPSWSARRGQQLVLVLGLVLWSAFFAVGHLAQGVDSAVGAGLLGMWFGALYLWRRNLVAAIVAHSLFDVVTLLVFWNLGR